MRQRLLNLFTTAPYNIDYNEAEHLVDEIESLNNPPTRDELENVFRRFRNPQAIQDITNEVETILAAVAPPAPRRRAPGTQPNLRAAQEPDGNDGDDDRQPQPPAPAAPPRDWWVIVLLLLLCIGVGTAIYFGAMEYKFSASAVQVDGLSDKLDLADAKLTDVKAISSEGRDAAKGAFALVLSATGGTVNPDGTVSVPSLAKTADLAQLAKTTDITAAQRVLVGKIDTNETARAAEARKMRAAIRAAARSAKKGHELVTSATGAVYDGDGELVHVDRLSTSADLSDREAAILAAIKNSKYKITIKDGQPSGVVPDPGP